MVFPAPFNAAAFKPEESAESKSEAVPESEAYPFIFTLFLAWFANFSTWLRKGENNDIFSDNQSGINSYGVGSSTGISSHNGVSSQENITSCEAGLGFISYSSEKTHDFHILSQDGKDKTYIINWACGI